MPTLTKLFSMQEAAEHKTKDDCWVVIDGKVYDVTSYLDDHPGGEEVFFEAVGKDAKEEFEDAGHSREAREQMEEYCIGELDDAASTIPELEISSKNQPDLVQKLKEWTSEYWAIPVTVAGISVVVGFLYLRKK